jgi:hypothetical protein
LVLVAMGMRMLVMMLMMMMMPPLPVATMRAFARTFSGRSPATPRRRTGFSGLVRVD